MTDQSWRLNFGNKLFIPDLVKSVRACWPFCKLTTGRIKCSPRKGRLVVRLTHTMQKRMEYRQVRNKDETRESDYNVTITRRDFDL